MVCETCPYTPTFRVRDTYIHSYNCHVPCTHAIRCENWKRLSFVLRASEPNPDSFIACGRSRDASSSEGRDRGRPKKAQRTMSERWTAPHSRTESTCCRLRDTARDWHRTRDTESLSQFEKRDNSLHACCSRKHRSISHTRDEMADQLHERISDRQKILDVIW